MTRYISLKRPHPLDEDGGRSPPPPKSRRAPVNEDFSPSQYHILEQAATILGKSLSELLALAYSAPRQCGTPQRDIGVSENELVIHCAGELQRGSTQTTELEATRIRDAGVAEPPPAGSDDDLAGMVGPQLGMINDSNLQTWCDTSAGADPDMSYMGALSEISDPVRWDEEYGSLGTGMESSGAAQDPTDEPTADDTLASLYTLETSPQQSRDFIPGLGPSITSDKGQDDLNVVLWTPEKLRPSRGRIQISHSSPSQPLPGLKVVSWDPSNAKQNPSPARQVRRPYQDPQKRKETHLTRKTKACVRCRMQKIRCQQNPAKPDGPCLTCAAVESPKVHSLACRRYKITECALYRTGKGPGLAFTFRWPVMKLKDITDWASPDLHTIDVLSNVCPVPLKLTVRRFIPVPKKDCLQTGWLDSGDRGVKKFKNVEPYAIVNMSTAAADMKRYIHRHMYDCIDFMLAESDPLIRETYAFARKHMTLAESEEDRVLLGNVFRLWFAIRRTATTEHISGHDKLGMEPELRDKSFPLFGKVPLPPVMIQQLDMIVTLGILQPLYKTVLEGLEKIVASNKPSSWLTTYLITFMLLHSCALLSAENYQNARKQGLKRRYAIPVFISELHQGANVLLTHFHYVTKACNPFTLNWKERQGTRFAGFTPDQIRFIYQTKEMAQRKKSDFSMNRELDIYEDELYFVAQLFEDDWSPRDTVIDYGDATLNNVPLKIYYGEDPTYGAVE